MRTIITGVVDGRSCIVREIDCDLAGDELKTVTLMDQSIAALPPRPPGSGELRNVGIPDVGAMIWFRVHFPPNSFRSSHHTDSIDFHTIVDGSIELILDDGAHRLSAGDGAVVTGVDHSWKTGPDGCTAAMFLIGTPKPA